MLSLLEINHTGVLLDLQGHRLFLWLQYDLKTKNFKLALRRAVVSFNAILRFSLSITM